MNVSDPFQVIACGIQVNFSLYLFFSSEQQWNLPHPVFNGSEGMKYKALILLRKTLVEHPFGTIKYWMGQIPLLLRGKEKVQAEIDLYATCYNLKRVTNIQSIRVLLQQVHEWTLK